MPWEPYDSAEERARAKGALPPLQPASRQACKVAAQGMVHEDGGDVDSGIARLKAELRRIGVEPVEAHIEWLAFYARTAAYAQARARQDEEDALWAALATLG